MKNQKSKTKQIITLISVAVVIVVVAIAYNFAYKFIPKKTTQSVQEIKSSDTRSSIFINNNSDGTDDGLEKLISLMNDNNISFYKTSTSDGIIGKDDVIILKINTQWDQRGGTNVDLVESVIKAIVSHPNGFTGEIVIADNGQAQFGSSGNGGSLDWEQSNGKDTSKSMLDLSEIYADNGIKVSTYLWDTITTDKVDEFENGNMNPGFVLDDNPNADTKITVSYPKFISEFGTYISFKNGIWDNDAKSYDNDKLKVINMPVLKTHMQYGVTGAVKGYMGVPSDKLSKNSHSTIGIGSMGTLMAETRVPALNIMDAIYINTNTDRKNSGPSTDYEDATFAKKILISTDPIALDYYAAGNVLYPAFEASGAVLALKHDRDSIEPGSFGYWLKLSLWQLTKAGYEFVMDEDKIDVYSVE